MSIDEREIRLRIVEHLLPSASKAGITDINIIIHKANELENYVKDGYSQDVKGEESPVVEETKVSGKPILGLKSKTVPHNPTRGKVDSKG